MPGQGEDKKCAPESTCEDIKCEIIKCISQPKCAPVYPSQVIGDVREPTSEILKSAPECTCQVNCYSEPKCEAIQCVPESSLKLECEPELTYEDILCAPELACEFPRSVPELIATIATLATIISECEAVKCDILDTVTNSSADAENPVQVNTTVNNKDTRLEEIIEDQLAELADNVECIKITQANEIVSELPEINMKHPLQNAWTFWFFKNDKSQSWEENQRSIKTVTTIEDFWALYNYIEVASRLPPGSDYALFKEGILPDWEDPRNQKGGRWMINLERSWREKYLDNFWLEILMFLIGEQADQHAHKVNGAVVNVRGKGDKLAVWLSDAAKPYSIGKMIKERLGIEPETKIRFNIHHNAKGKIFV